MSVAYPTLSFHNSANPFIKYPHHSAHEWRNFWKANIRPIYLKQQKALKAANIRRAESVVDSNATKKPLELKKAPLQSNGDMVSTGILSLPERPRTPVLPKRRGSSEATEDSLVENSIEPTIGEDLTIVKSTKRKRDNSVQELPRSSPPDFQQSPYSKRRRTEIRPPIQNEIPSTPERSPLSIRRHPPTLVKYNIIKLEEESDMGSAEEDENGDYDEAPGQQASQSLSEPEQALVEMRNVFKDPRRLMDFEVPAPEGGWEENDFQADPDDELEIAETINRREDTQAILQGETPAFDFSVPEPEEGWDLLIQPPFPSSPPIPIDEAGDYANNETPAELMDEEEMIAILEKWLDTRMESGVDAVTLGLVLKSTNNDPELADIVLESLDNDEGVPTDIRGIWTEEDDECLDAVDARKINAMIEKHGQEGLDKRYDFLKTYNAN